MARRAVKLVGPRLTYWVIPAAWIPAKRKAPIRHKHFVGGQECLRLLSQVSLQRGFAGLVRGRTHEQAGEGQALCPHGADAVGDAQRDCRQRLTGRRTVVLGCTPVEAWTPEAHQVTGDRAVAPMPVGLPVTFVVDQVVPGGQEPWRVPAPIRERGPRTPHSRLWQPEGGKAGDDRPTALEQATAEEHPQQMEET